MAPSGAHPAHSVSATGSPSEERQVRVRVRAPGTTSQGCTREDRGVQGPQSPTSHDAILAVQGKRLHGRLEAGGSSRAVVHVSTVVGQVLPSPDVLMHTGAAMAGASGSAAALLMQDALHWPHAPVDRQNRPGHAELPHGVTVAGLDCLAHRECSTAVDAPCRVDVAMQLTVRYRCPTACGPHGTLQSDQGPVTHEY